MVGKAVISTPKRQWQEYPQSKPVCESLSQKIQAKQKLFLIWHVSKMGCRLQSFQLMLQCFTVNTNKASSFSCKGFGWLVRKYHSCMWPQHMKRDTGSFAWLFYDLIFFRSFYIWISYTTYVIIDINICIYNQAYILSIKCSEETTVIGMWFSWHPQVASKILSQARLLQQQGERNLWDSATSPDTVF